MRSELKHKHASAQLREMLCQGFLCLEMRFRYQAMSLMRFAYLVLLASALIVNSGVQAFAVATSEGETIVICTGEGLQQITLDANGDPVTSLPHCPDCVAQAKAVLEQPATGKIVLSFANAPGFPIRLRSPELPQIQFPTARDPPAV